MEFRMSGISDRQENDGTSDGLYGISDSVDGPFSSLLISASECRHF